MASTSPTGEIYYSQEGGNGQTRFGAYGMLPKFDTRVTAAEECDEANAAVSLVMAAGNVSADVVALLQSVQNDLFDVVADLRCPLDGTETATARIRQEHITRLERAIDYYVRDAEDLTGVILPGGTLHSALMYSSRTVVRRAERAAWAAVEAHPEQVNPLTGQYLNRLSTLLFVLFRVENAELGDLSWVPEHSVLPLPDGQPEGRPEGQNTQTDGDAPA